MTMENQDSPSPFPPGFGRAFRSSESPSPAVVEHLNSERFREGIRKLVELIKSNTEQQNGTLEKPDDSNQVPS